MNFDFIQDKFIEAKTALKEEQKTGVVSSDRLKGIGLEGASRTGKTWDASVFICHYTTTYTGKRINICRDNLTRLKKTTYDTFSHIWKDKFRLPSRHINKTASEIHYNGNVIRFVGVNDDIMVAHGLESDLLWVNETMSVAKETLNQLEQRTKEFFIYDYNPSATEHFLFDKELESSYSLLKTTIFDNEYAPANAKAKILSYAHPECDDWIVAKKAGYTSEEEWVKFKLRNLEIGTADKYMWEVYGLGLRAVGEDVIFNKWELYAEEPEGYDWVVYGGDFGYTTDPTAYIKVKKTGNSLYLKECFYESGLLNNEIADKIKTGGWDDFASMWDSSELKSIQEMRVLGIPADRVYKPAGSVVWGIQKIKQHKVFIHVESKNLQAEFNKYRWATDRLGEFKRDTDGRRVPADKDNHGIDAVRYALFRYMQPTETSDGD